MGLLDDPNVVMGLLGASAGLLTPTIGGQFGAGVANGLRGGMQGFMGNRQYELEAARNAAELENLKAHAEYYRRQADPRLSEKYGLTPLIDETGAAWQLTDRGGLKKVDLPGRKFQPLINQDLGGYRTTNDPYTAAPIRRFDKTQTPDGIMREGQILEPAGAPAGDGTLPPLPNPAPGAPLPNLPPPGGASFNFANPEDAKRALEDYAKNGATMPGRVARPVPGFVENKARLKAAEAAAGLPAKAAEAQIQTQQAASEITAKDRANARLQLPGFLDTAQQTLGLVDKIVAHPGLSGVVGIPSVLGLLNAPASKEADFRALLDQLKGRQFLQAFETLKGGGQITEVEGKKATEAVAAMQTAQSEEAFKQAAKDFQTTIKRAMERAKARAGGTAEDMPEPSQSAPSVDELIQMYRTK